MGKHQHIVQHGGEWAVLGEGNLWVTSKHPTQREAIEAAKIISIRQHSDVIIHGKDGKFRERYSYGNDPFLPKG